MPVAMRFQYGQYQAELDSVSINTVTQSMVPAANGKPMLRRVRWQIAGKIISSDNTDPQADVLNKAGEIANAFTANYQDCGFPGTPFYFRNSETFGGVVVTQPFSVTGVHGAEGVTYLKWQAGIEANYLYADAIAGMVVAFEEEMSYRSNDGLPIYAERLPVNGPPILQQVSDASWFYGSQKGSIEVLGEVNADPLPMLFPGLLRTSTGSGVNVSFKSPRMFRDLGLTTVTTWAYEYISIIPFFSYPSIRR